MKAMVKEVEPADHGHQGTGQQWPSQTGSCYIGGSFDLVAQALMNFAR